MKRQIAKTDQSSLISRIANLSPAKRALLEQRLKGRAVVAERAGGIPRRGPGDSAPLSFSQQRLWFLDQYEPNSSVYNVASALRLRGPLDVGVLERSVNEIVGRHEALRTSFRVVGGEPVQVIAPFLRIELSVEDLSGCPEEEREEEARRLAREEARRPFDLSEGPLFRAGLIRLGDEDHILLLTLHHIVSDGWSMGVLHRELSDLYGAFVNGRPSPLAALPVQYADFALWQREWLQGEVLEKQLAYWKKQLEGISAVINLPTDRARPAVQSFRGKTQSIELSEAVGEGLKRLSREEGVTLFMVFLAAFQVLLYRYTGEEDIVVGSPIANRNRVEIEGLIGFFVNTLVLRTDLSGNPSFRELLGRVRKSALEAYEHQDLPFEKLVEELQPQRSLSHSPLFQVAFAYQNTPRTGLSFEGLSVSPLQVGAETAKFDLTLSMHEAPAGLSGFLQYSRDLFDDATITRLVGHLRRLLEGVAANCDERIGYLAMLRDTEKHQLLIEWNDTKRVYPREKCIHELFEEQAERTPEAVAVVFEDQELTYRELNRRANQLAHYLQKQGVGPEVLVGICVERSVEMVIGLLGILKAGGVYVPLDPDYPKQRLGFMLEDTRAPVMVMQGKLIEKLPHHKARTVCLDEDWAEISRESQNNPPPLATSGHLAYIIYTSGSTGKPKGVAVQHRAVNRLLFNTNYIKLEPSDAIAQISNCAFDAATFEIWGALLHGARLVVLPAPLVLSPQDFAASLLKYGITTMFVTTALFNNLVQQVRGVFQSLCYILFGGEAVDPKWVREVVQTDPPEQLLHVYGPTESTTFTTWYRVTHVPSGAGTIPIGRPIGNTEMYLLDRYLQPVPIGVVGELCIGGEGLAQGYLNRPQLTAERFVPNPFSNLPGARLYKTGDLGRYLSDGNIEFLSRIDNQVKIRGFRIELGEIESVLSRYRGVREAAVLLRQDKGREKELVAYLVLAKEGAPTVAEIRNQLKIELPEYMIPSFYVLLDALPLTHNGKVDRQALPIPDQSRPNMEESFVAPRTDVEKLLAEIWKGILNVERVGVHDNFFDLGGHSLLATRLVSELGRKFGRKITVTTLFQSPTIAQLASVLA